MVDIYYFPSDDDLKTPGVYLQTQRVCLQLVDTYYFPSDDDLKVPGVYLQTQRVFLQLVDTYYFPSDDDLKTPGVYLQFYPDTDIIRIIKFRQSDYKFIKCRINNNSRRIVIICRLA